MKWIAPCGGGEWEEGLASAVLHGPEGLSCFKGGFGSSVVNESISERRVCGVGGGGKRGEGLQGVTKFLW